MTTVQKTQMQAVVRDRYGSVESVELRDVPRPQVAADEVLVRVVAAGVDRGVVHVMTGLPYPIRLAGYGVRAPKNLVLGSDVAGVVDQVGAAVTRFRPGDEVFGIAQGSFAQYASANETKLAPKPAGLTFEQAAALPVSGLTALQAVRDRAQVRPGARVLVIGASGGVGGYVVQLAKAFGGEVTGVCSAAKTDLVRSLGADHVLDYRVDDFADGQQQYDVVLDVGGNSSLTRLRRALTGTGTLVIVGGETDGRWLGGTDRQLRALVLSLFVGQKLGTFIASENHEDLLALSELVEAGKVRPALDRTFPLAEAAAAIRQLQDGQVRGKIVLTTRP
ncbi:NAD(P)-dependent alcohol dehydrogenase [Angustibacter sp. McL0619]|uniref:NAD(P)-dependent alcohol dehydrogenase n=1 Tax=Angustibacter sp. McL0619 TaxID=3415676 RepID=UPI003CEA4082